jgi:hypothetical protein
MMPARWAVTRRIASGSALVLISAGLTGCAGLIGSTPPPAPAPAAPPANAAAATPAEPCPFITRAQVAQLAGDQRNQLMGSVNACSFNIASRFTYQINVFTNDNNRFQSERDRLYKNSTDLDGLGDEAFFRDGTAITTLGVRQGNTYFTVNLVPAVADPAGGANTAPPVVDAPAGAAAADADVNDDGVVDADLDEDGAIDDNADPAAAAAADADNDGQVDDGALAAGQDAQVRGAAGAPVDSIEAAKARMPEIAQAVSDNI